MGLIEVIEAISATAVTALSLRQSARVIAIDRNFAFFLLSFSHFESMDEVVLYYSFGYSIPRVYGKINSWGRCLTIYPSLAVI
jgi:hypothetical protein